MPIVNVLHVQWDPESVQWKQSDIYELILVSAVCGQMATCLYDCGCMLVYVQSPSDLIHLL